MRLAKFCKAALAVKKGYPSVSDIVIFGSSMRGKEIPGDIDILVIFRDKVDKAAEMPLRELLRSDSADVNSITESEMKGDGFVAKEGVYLEGYSLLRRAYIADEIGFASLAMIRYDLKDVTGSKRIRFYYALHGRNAPGFLDEIGAKRFSENTLVCDYQVADKVGPFFSQWGIDVEIVPVLVPKRLYHILLAK